MHIVNCAKVESIGILGGENVIDKVIQGISHVLGSVFAYRVYTEKLLEGVQLPCFLIEHIALTQEKRINNHYVQMHKIKIKYFSKDKTMEDNNRIAEQLHSILEYVSLSQNVIIRSSKTESKIVDDVLQFETSYIFHVNKAEQIIDKMAHISVRSRG